MAPEGENVGEHIARKYGSTPEQSAANRAMIRERAGGRGLRYADGADDSRIWNTFDAHRLLHWAHETAPEKQKALKQALFAAHFTENRNITDARVLTEAAAKSRGWTGPRRARCWPRAATPRRCAPAEDLWRVTRDQFGPRRGGRGQISDLAADSRPRRSNRR